MRRAAPTAPCSTACTTASATATMALSATLEPGALEQLEQRSCPTDRKGLEVPFYLVNAYQNLSRPETRTASRPRRPPGSTSGENPEPENPLEMFPARQALRRSGTRDEPAPPAGTRAPGAGFPRSIATSGPYVTVASRYLAEPAFRRGDHEATARYYGVIAEAGEASAVDLDRLATAQYRLATTPRPAESWRLAADGREERSQGNRCALLLEPGLLAANVGATARDESPDGRPWDALGKDELRDFMIGRGRSRAKLAFDEARVPESLTETGDGRNYASSRSARPRRSSSPRHSSTRCAATGSGRPPSSVGYAPMIFHNGRVAHRNPAPTTRSARRKSPTVALTRARTQSRSARSPSIGSLKRSPSSARTMQTSMTRAPRRSRSTRFPPRTSRPNTAQK